jgi:hypothetical protein
MGMVNAHHHVDVVELGIKLREAGFGVWQA